MDVRSAILRRKKELGWPATKIARRADVDLDSLRRWLSGKRPAIRTDTLEKIATAMGLVLGTRSGFYRQ